MIADGEGGLGCDVVVTRSGAVAVRDRASGEVMHPMGPAMEASGVYVVPSRLEARLRGAGFGAHQQEQPLVVLDIGLGAASNALAAWRVSESLEEGARRLEIVSFDHDLAPLRLALEPEHADAFGLAAPDPRAAANALVTQGRHETSRTLWRLSFGDILLALSREPEASADIVFWDMYSRSVNPELWTSSTFRALRRVCREGATVHTYNAATATRSALLLAGFAVGVGDPTGDRDQTTVAAVNVKDLARPLDTRWLARLARSSAPFPPDVPDDARSQAEARARIEALPQFG